MQIDWWTLAFQTVNVLILIWILGRFFFRPVADMVARRQAEADKLLADAQSARAAAQADRAKAAEALSGLDRDRERQVAEARKAAEAARQEILAQADQEAEKRRQAGQVEIARARAAAQSEMIAKAGALSVDIARRLLGRLSSAAAQAVFVDGLCRDLQSRSSAAGQAGEVEIVSATKLPAAQAKRVGEAVQAAFGAEATCRFSVDPDLIAGLELRGRHILIRNSWRADLARIREELDRGQGGV